MQSSLRVVRLIRLIMLSSVVIYAGMATWLGHPSAQPSFTLFYGLTVMAASLVLIILIVRRTMVVRAEAVLADQPGNVDALKRWQAGYLVTYVLCEALALYGLVLQFLGFTLSQVATFYVAAIALMLFFSPRPPSRELS